PTHFLYSFYISIFGRIYTQSNPCYTHCFDILSLTLSLSLPITLDHTQHIPLSCFVIPCDIDHSHHICSLFPPLPHMTSISVVICPAPSEHILPPFPTKVASTKTQSN